MDEPSGSRHTSQSAAYDPCSLAVVHSDNYEIILVSLVLPSKSFCASSIYMLEAQNGHIYMYTFCKPELQADRLPISN